MEIDAAVAPRATNGDTDELIIVLLLASSIALFWWVLANREAPIPEGATKACPQCGHVAPMRAESCPSCGLQQKPRFNVPLYVACLYLAFVLLYIAILIRQGLAPTPR
jgi:hypothetical protein